jgi:hypothetical protein
MDTNKNQPAFQITTNLKHLTNQTSEYNKYDNQVSGVPLTIAPTSTQTGSGHKKVTTKKSKTARKSKTVRKNKITRKTKKHSGGMPPKMKRSFNTRTLNNRLENTRIINLSEGTFDNINRKIILLLGIINDFQVNTTNYLDTINHNLYNISRCLDRFKERYNDFIERYTEVKLSFEELNDVVNRYFILLRPLITQIEDNSQKMNRSSIERKYSTQLEGITRDIFMNLFIALRNFKKSIEDISNQNIKVMFQSGNKAINEIMRMRKN